MVGIFRDLPVEAPRVPRVTVTILPGLVQDESFETPNFWDLHTLSSDTIAHSSYTKQGASSYIIRVSDLEKVLHACDPSQSGSS